MESRTADFHRARQRGGNVTQLYAFVERQYGDRSSITPRYSWIVSLPLAVRQLSGDLADQVGIRSDCAFKRGARKHREFGVADRLNSCRPRFSGEQGELADGFAARQLPHCFHGAIAMFDGDAQATRKYDVHGFARRADAKQDLAAEHAG